MGGWFGGVGGNGGGWGAVQKTSSPVNMRTAIERRKLWSSPANHGPWRLWAGAALKSLQLRLGPKTTAFISPVASWGERRCWANTAPSGEEGGIYQQPSLLPYLPLLPPLPPPDPLPFFLPVFLYLFLFFPSFFAFKERSFLLSFLFSFFNLFPSFSVVFLFSFFLSFPVFLSFSLSVFLSFHSFHQNTSSAADNVVGFVCNCLRPARLSRLNGNFQFQNHFHFFFFNFLFLLSFTNPPPPTPVSHPHRLALATQASKQRLALIISGLIIGHLKGENFRQIVFFPPPNLRQSHVFVLLICSLEAV